MFKIQVDVQYLPVWIVSSAIFEGKSKGRQAYHNIFIRGHT